MAQLSEPLMDKLLREKTPLVAGVYGAGYIDVNDYWNWDDGPWLPVRNIFHTRVWGVAIDTDAMEPDFPRGTYIIIRQAQMWELRHQEDVIIVHGDECDWTARFGRVRLHEEDKLKLDFLNAEYPPVLINCWSVGRVGKIVKVLKPDRPCFTSSAA